MGPVRRSAAALLAGSGCLALLAGCSQEAPQADLPELADVQLHPNGDPGNWLLDAYAEGVDHLYATSNPVCAVGENQIVEVQRGPEFTSRVIAKELAQGTVLWEIDDAVCFAGGGFEGAVSVDVDLHGDRDWRLIDISTGESLQDLPLEPLTGSLEPIARADDLLVAKIDSSRLGGLDANTEVWSVPLRGNSEVTPLADGYLGIEDGLSGRASIIDGRTGETVMEREIPQAGWLTWASDGFVLKVNETDPEYAFYDLRGEEVDRTDGTSQYPFVPSPRDDVTFAIADHVGAGPVVGVDANGRAALFEGDGQRDFTPSGEIEELPDSIISLQGVSQSGSLLLFDDDAQDGRIALIDAEGEEVFGWSVPSGADTGIESGYIVTESGGTTQVLLPAG